MPCPQVELLEQEAAVELQIEAESRIATDKVLKSQGLAGSNCFRYLWNQDGTSSTLQHLQLELLQEEELVSASEEHQPKGRFGSTDPQPYQRSLLRKLR